jgi:predicted 3-demethylubiquinone-9 3-methyltransferase (glyoxalase superfamily)
MTVTGLTTFLWFDKEAEEAAEFYVSLFPQSRLGNISRYPEGSRLPAGTVMTIEFEIFGQSFTCLNGGPMFPHSEAVSFQVSCDTQEEVDHLWNSLIADGGAESQCGWCKDKFGVSWQIIPKALSDALSSNDPDISSYAMQAMMKMGKIIIKDLYLKQ